MVEHAVVSLLGGGEDELGADHSTGALPLAHALPAVGVGDGEVADGDVVGVSPISNAVPVHPPEELHPQDPV